MKLFNPYALVCALILIISSCGDYNKDNTTAVSRGPLPEGESIKKHHPGLHTINILEMKFQPASLTIAKGDTVVWVNQDLLAHDVTEEVNKSWTSGRMESGATWQKVMTESVNYFCSLHLVMKGKIKVAAEMPVAGN